MPELSAFAMILAALIVFFAGIVDALAGGGGLITIPAYLAAGVPAHLVLGTNKLTSTIGTSMAAVQYHRKLKLPVLDFFSAIAASFLGSMIGAGLALLAPADYLRYILIVALPVLIYWLYFHRHHIEKIKIPEASYNQKRREALAALPIGVYDGFFGPGTGTFFALALNRYCHYPILEATARSKILNLASNVAALAAFLISGRTLIGLGLAMGAVNLAGNYVGSRLGLRSGASVIRPAMIFVCSLLFVKIVWDLRKG